MLSLIKSTHRSKSQRLRNFVRAAFASTILALATAQPAVVAAEPVVLNLWPGKPPGETKELPPEGDLTKPEDKLIAGRRIIKLGNVSTPQKIGRAHV